jgi:hypothetical protein
MCVCVGPPDSIVLGSFGCLIEGKPAARMGDQCAHGGMIVMGCFTVLIGNNGGAGSPQGLSMGAARGAASPFVSANCNKAADGSKSPGQSQDGSSSGTRDTKPLGWIEVKVEDEDGNPVQGELVRIVDAEGNTVERFSPPDGLVRVDGIAKGNAKVTFPGLDKEVWRKA